MLSNIKVQLNGMDTPVIGYVGANGNVWLEHDEIVAASRQLVANGKQSLLEGKRVEDGENGPASRIFNEATGEYLPRRFVQGSPVYLLSDLAEAE